MKFHHIGIATENISVMTEYLKNIMEINEVGPIVSDPLQQADLCMVRLSDGTQIELISGPVVEKLVRKRNFLYHICYETDDIEKQITNLLAHNAILISEAKEAVLFDYKKVAFLMTEMGLIELVES